MTSQTSAKVHVCFWATSIGTAFWMGWLVARGLCDFKPAHKLKLTQWSKASVSRWNGLEGCWKQKQLTGCTVPQTRPTDIHQSVQRLTCSRIEHTAGMMKKSSHPNFTLPMNRRDTNLARKKTVSRTMKAMQEAYKGLRAS